MKSEQQIKRKLQILQKIANNIEHDMEMYDADDNLDDDTYDRMSTEFEAAAEKIMLLKWILEI